MALSIKNSETERLARQVASESGEKITEAIATALAERLERLRSRKRRRPLKDRLGDILRRMDALPALDSRTSDEILGYDERGIPR